MKPLTDDFAGLKSRLDIMTPYAWTHIAVGVEFGFQMLSDNPVFDDDATSFNAASYDDDETKKFKRPFVLFLPSSQEQFTSDEIEQNRNQPKRNQAHPIGVTSGKKRIAFLRPGLETSLDAFKRWI